MSGRHDEFIEIRKEAATIAAGTSTRLICPFCTGGSTAEKSFSVTRVSEAEARYHCFRATCGRSGRLAVWGARLAEVHGSDSKPGKQFTPRMFRGDTRELGEDWLSELYILYELRREDCARMDWRETTDGSLLVVPVLSTTGVSRGCETRRSKSSERHSSQESKTKSHRSLDEVWMGWYRRTHSTGPVAVLEDPISSLKVSRHLQVACLHGSHISEDHILELTSVSDDLVLALDPDATDKAIKFIQKWRFLAPNFRTVPLSKDLKYSTDQEIKEILS